MNLKNMFAEIEACLPEGGGWCDLNKANSLAALLIAMRARTVVELGIWQGGSAIPMAIALRTLGAGKIVCVDAWHPDASVQGQVNPQDVKWWGTEVGNAGHDKAYRTFMSRIDKHKLGPFCEVRRMRSDEGTVPAQIDLLHVDGNHGDQAIADVERWGSAVRLGGIMVLDDLNWTGGSVERAHERAQQLGFLDLYTMLDGNCMAMQRIHSTQHIFRPTFSPRSYYVLRDGNEAKHFEIAGGAPEAPLISWATGFIEPDKTFVDVGAHVGTWAQHFAQSCAKVHAFEPQRSTYARLCEGVRLSGLSNIVCYNTAIGGQGEVDLHILTLDGGGSTLHHRPELGQEIAIERVPYAQLDDFDLGHVGLMKLDVEGNELNCLRGAQRTLSMYRPRLLLEAWLHPWYAGQRQELIAFLQSIAYKVEPVTDWPEMLLAEPAP